MANPNHEPAGSDIGGQFAKGNGAVNTLIRKGAGQLQMKPEVLKAILDKSVVLQDRLAEDRAKGKARERAFTLDQNGEIVSSAIGVKTDHSVPMDARQGQVFLHSHPDGTSFSRSDLVMAAERNLAAVVVSGKYVYIMRPGSSWPSSDALETYFKQWRKTRGSELDYEQIASEFGLIYETYPMGNQ